MINNYLTGAGEQDDHSIHLLFSANRWEAVKSITEALEAGVAIVIDRYSFSGAVYSAAKGNPDLSLDWAWYPEVGLPKPDLLLFLDISSGDAATRGGYGAERYETETMQGRVRELFKELFSRLDHVPVEIINAGNALEVVAAEVQSAVSRILVNYFSTSKPLQKLGPLLDGS
jgi:dTMP kinase